MEPLPDSQPFRVCRTCGALTPRATRWCVECGVADEPLERQLERQEERRFAEVFFGRATRATSGLLAVNVVLFAGLAYVSGEAFLPDLSYVVTLVNFGGAVKSFIAQGEYWRLVTAMFLHIGVIHVAINGYALWIVGQQVEKLYGAARFLVLYFLTGLAGSVASYLAPTPGAPSAGASGAIFGLFGILFVFGIRYRNELPGVFGKAFGARVLPTILINLVITFAIEFIDKGAHIGGLVAGMVLAAVVPYARPTERRASIAWRVAAFVCAACVVASFIAAYTSPKRTAQDLIAAGVVGAAPETLGNFVDHYNRSDAALAVAVKAIDAARNGDPLDPAGSARAAEGANDARAARGLDPIADALLDRQAALLDRAAVLLDPSRGRPSDSELETFVRDKRALDADWKKWVADNGKKHGLTMSPN